MISMTTFPTIVWTRWQSRDNRLKKAIFEMNNKYKK